MSVSRRRVIESLLAIGSAPLSMRASETNHSNPVMGDVANELKFPPDVLAQLARDAQGAIRQAEWLRDLPLGGLLDGVPPGFTFLPE